MSENEQIEFQKAYTVHNADGRVEYQFGKNDVQPPKPYHPQSRFGSGVQAADRAWPNLAAYYGEGFQVNFTTLDLLDSLAARVKILEDEGTLGMEVAKRYDAQFQRMVTDIFAEPAREMRWWQRWLYKLQGRTK